MSRTVTNDSLKLWRWWREQKINKSRKFEKREGFEAGARCSSMERVVGVLEFAGVERGVANKCWEGGTVAWDGGKRRGRRCLYVCHSVVPEKKVHAYL